MSYAGNSNSPENSNFPGNSDYPGNNNHPGNRNESIIVQNRNRSKNSLNLNLSRSQININPKIVNSAGRESLSLNLGNRSQKMETSSFLGDTLKREDKHERHHEYMNVDPDLGFTSSEDTRKGGIKQHYSHNGVDDDYELGFSNRTHLLQTSKRKITTVTHFKESDEHESPMLEHRNKQHEEDIRSQEDTKKEMNKRKRVIGKGGTTNVTYKNISKKKRKYFLDLYTTLLDSQWGFLVIMFAASFYFSWLFFAVIYYVISFLHNDFLEENLNNTAYMPCILAVDGFSAAFLFSLETQHTIGYGTRQTTTECPDAMLFMSLQSVFGCLIQAFMVGLVFSKLSRPSSRSKTVIFSQNMVVNIRNRKLCLIFRIGDLRDDNFILGVQISAKLMRRRITNEGELFQEMQMLKVDPDNSNEPCIFFVWPLEIVHVIDETSPLYEMSAADLSKEKFEIIVIMEGTIETSSMNFQARTSYLTNEVLWGQRFEPMTLYRKDHNKFQVNFSAFNSTYEVETPLCSAKELDNYNSNNLLRQQRVRLSMNHIPRPPPSVMADHHSQFGDHPVHHQPYSQPPHYPGYNSYLTSPEHIHRSASVSSRQAPPVNHQESPGFNHQQTTMPVTSPPPLHSLDSDSSIDMSTKKEVKKEDVPNHN